MVPDTAVTTSKRILACFVLSFTFAVIGFRLHLADEFTLSISSLLR